MALTSHVMSVEFPLCPACSCTQPHHKHHRHNHNVQPTSALQPPTTVRASSSALTAPATPPMTAVSSVGHLSLIPTSPSISSQNISLGSPPSINVSQSANNTLRVRSPLHSSGAQSYATLGLSRVGMEKTAEIGTNVDGERRLDITRARRTK